MQLLPPSAQISNYYRFGLLFTGLGAMVALLYYGRGLCITLVVSLVISFILEPLVNACMRLRIPRSIAAFFVCTIALLLIYLLGLGLFSQVANLVEELPTYSQRINDLVDHVAERIERTEKNAYRLLVPKRFQEISPPQPEPPAPVKRRKRSDPPPAPAPPQVQEVSIRQDRVSVFQSVYGYASSFYNVLLMTSFVPFLVFFMLSWRDLMRVRFLALFEGPDRVVAGRAWNNIGEMARAYVLGNFILGLLLAVVSCVIFWSWALPYWLLIGFVSGFLSLVPYVGLPLALLPPMGATLMMYDNVAPFVAIAATVSLLHLLALNFLYPSIVGARVHLNPLAVTVALMFWGTVWGAAGLVLAIPVTAGLKAILDSSEDQKAWGGLLGD